ncbi:MAG: ATP-binding protein [Pseudomonadota bacterium]
MASNDLNLRAVETLSRVLSAVPNVIYVFNQKTQSNEYTNRSIEEVLGYTEDEISAFADQVMAKLAHPDDLPQIIAHFGAIHDLKDDEVLTLEYRMRHRDGHWVWLLSYDTAFGREEDGTLLRHVGTASDITHQKQKEARAAATRDEFETIFEAATSGIVALDADGLIMRANMSARHMLGGVMDEAPFAWPEAIKFLDAETLHPLEASADPVQRALAGHSLKNETHLIRRSDKDDERRYVRVGNATVDNELSGIRTVLVIDDVSNEERNRQVVERKSRLDALGQLTGGIAHDFNNLLASLLYSVNLASSAKTEERRNTYLETAAQAVNRGRALTNRLLAFARRQPALASVKKTTDVFEEFQALLRPMLEAHLELAVRVEEPGLRHFCDQAQLETALMNLVLNARDAILREGKGSKIDIRARPVRAPLKNLDEDQEAEQPKELDSTSFRYVEISVSDDGPGMDEETVARCTDPFFTTKDTNSGTGLGLAIVYGFVRQANGDLRIYSEVDVGTTVQMTLPRGTALGDREEAMPEDAVKRGNGERLLVVEDELQLLVMMTDVLEDLGYQVVGARSGLDAIETFGNGDGFDLVITDVVMPGKISGFELARRLRATAPHMRVIYTSGYTGFTAAEMGEVQAPLLQKPSPPAEVAATIHRELAKDP